MKLLEIATSVSVVTIAATLLSAAVAQPAQGPGVPLPEQLPWAFPFMTPGAAHPADEVVKHVPGSSAAYTRAQIEDPFAAPDWFPTEHPPMPDVVARGKKPDVQACARCHLAHGFGHPQSANLAGLPSAYIVQQMLDFGSGRRTNSAIMTKFAAAMTGQEIKAASDYFASMKPQRWVRVIESETVPKSHFAGGGLRLRDEAGGTEPLGRRIIELPEDDEQVENRNPHSGFVAYVPVGSLKRGAGLVSGGGGRSVSCAICHGQGLRGLATVPSIAGRSPIGTVRQLIGFQNGARNGEWAPLMKGVVDRLTLDEIIDIAAITASLQP
jgi:cytochrome c553